MFYTSRNSILLCSLFDFIMYKCRIYVWLSLCFLRECFRYVQEVNETNNKLYWFVCGAKMGLWTGRQDLLLFVVKEVYRHNINGLSDIKMNTKKYHIVEIVPQSNRQIVLIFLIVFDFSPFFCHALLFCCQYQSQSQVWLSDFCHYRNTVRVVIIHNGWVGVMNWFGGSTLSNTQSHRFFMGCNLDLLYFQVKIIVKSVLCDLHREH